MPVNEMLLRGGFPKMALAEHSPTTLDAAQRLGDYIQRYLSRDLRDLAQVNDLGRFEVLMRHLATKSARSLNLSDVSREVHIPKSTVSDWLGLLEASRIFWTVDGYARKLSKRASLGKKGFFADCGLMTALLGYQTPDQLSRSPLLGAIFETAAANAVMSLVRLTNVNPTIFHYRYDEDEEVDLVLELDASTLCPIEIKHTSRPSAADCQGIDKFRKRTGTKGIGLLVSAGTDCFWVTKDILHLPWLAF